MSAATLNTPAILPGFSDPVAGAQAVFRTVLDAMAHPGRIHEIGADNGVPDGLSPAMTAILLTLIDVDAPLWLPPGVSTGTARFLRFHCGSRIVEQPDQAAFVAVPAGHAAPLLRQCRQGDPAYPDRSATLILEVESFEGGSALRLTGPGIRHEAHLAARGLPGDFPAQWQANHQRFPLGVDALLTQGRLICGLPRTCRMEVR